MPQARPRRGPAVRALVGSAWWGRGRIPVRFMYLSQHIRQQRTTTTAAAAAAGPTGTHRVGHGAPRPLSHPAEAGWRARCAGASPPDPDSDPPLAHSAPLVPIRNLSTHQPKAAQQHQPAEL